MKNLVFLCLVVFFAGCANKSVTVTTLQPSKVSNQNIHYVSLQQFVNDDINQTQYMEDALSNASIANNKLFTIKPGISNIDATITGDILESSLKSDIYYKKYDDEYICIKYDYKYKKRTCIKKIKRKYPCEKRDYTVKTQVKIFNPQNDIIFSKIYKKTKHEDDCYKQSMHLPNYPYRNSYLYDEKIRVNTQLAKQIAQDVIEDITPHYEKQAILLIDELEEDKYSQKTNEEFEYAIELLDEKQLDLAENNFLKLNEELNSKSYEILYNLGVINELKHRLPRGLYFYNKAKALCEDIDNLKIINSSISRLKENMLNEEKAKTQLIYK